ncbi:hypothetical protein CCR75_000510 [Bremia lactucae]|uniref:DNA ligase n=1 Tax=Bremia lactucae TaxID=4779 RepID=A0A976NYQ2_BRELC|nr:hypothetical protein CCR75_000510 [Bremia lactucae]
MQVNNRALRPPLSSLAQRIVPSLIWQRSQTTNSVFRSVSCTQNSGSFEALARTFASIEEVKSSRIVSIGRLADEYRRLLALSTPRALASALYLTASQLASPYEGVELRFGAKSFVNLLRQLETKQGSKISSEQTLDKLLASYPDYGQATQALLDSGCIAIPTLEKSREPLKIQMVHDQLMEIASDKGVGGMARKQQLALKLLQQCRCSEERIFIVRMLAHQNLRIRMGDKSILSALAMASFSSNDSEQASEMMTAWIDCVTLAYAQHPNFCVLAESVHASQHKDNVSRRIEWMHHQALPTTGVPVLTMSAYPVSSIAAVLDRVIKTKSRTATCEYKYDGVRVQVHLSVSNSNGVTRSVGRIFSRNMEDVTERYSSLLNVLEMQIKARNATVRYPTPVTSLTVEGEVVAVDREKKEFFPFQVLQTKTTTEFCLFLFDLLVLNGTNLLQAPLRKRRNLLHDSMEEVSGYVEFVKRIDITLSTNDAMSLQSNIANETAAVQECLERAVTSGCEGLMVKILDDDDSQYRAGHRTYSWMKLKHDYIFSAPKMESKSKKRIATTGNGTFLADTLDLVPIGAFHGKGRRAGVFGSFLMATYNSTSGKFETIGKVGTGFLDAELLEVTARFQEHILPEANQVPMQYQSVAIQSRHPDFWLSPEEVWEIKATQLTKSSSYTCGAGLATTKVDNLENVSPAKGLALRFPRFIRFRTDKNPLQATDSDEVVKYFEQQQQLNSC